MARKPFTFYMHSEKDSNYEHADELELSDKAIEKFIYTGYEVRFECEVDTETGEAYAKSVEGVALEKEVRI